MDTKSRITDLAIRYEHNPVIRTLIQLVPFGIGSAVDTAIATTIDKIREKRARAFFDELDKHDLVLTEEQINTEDFLHAYFATMKMALNTRRQKKIRLFTRLFANYIQERSFDNVDDYEDMLTVLDDLSYREFQILLILNRFEKRYLPQKDQNPAQWIGQFWDEFLSSVESEIGIPIDQIPGILARLNRTGLYKTITGTYFDYSGDQGHLTPNFATFLDALGITGSDVS